MNHQLGGQAGLGDMAHMGLGGGWGGGWGAGMGIKIPLNRKYAIMICNIL